MTCLTFNTFNITFFNITFYYSIDCSEATAPTSVSKMIYIVV